MLRLSFPLCLALFLSATNLSGATDDPVPSRMGLQLWLDAANDDSFDGADVRRWKDLSGAGRDAIALPTQKPPQRLANALAGKPVVRFEGKTCFTIPPMRSKLGPAAIFVVARRPDSLTTDSRWQRLVSCSDPESSGDTNRPGLSVIANTGKNSAGGGPFAATVYEQIDSEVSLAQIAVGSPFHAKHGYFHGDIAEVLIYDRSFLAEDEIQSVLQYLANKWSATIAREEQGWTRHGPLSNPPRRQTDAYPLSDQMNQAGWRLDESLTDEFDGKELDSRKWLPKHKTWKGRQPAFFWTKNVRVDDGTLQLTMRKQEAPEMPKNRGYRDYTSACVQALGKTLYGYFEVRAKPMNSAGSSSFWFAGSGDGWQTEIDVYEIGGKAPGFERKYNMNAHVFYTPDEHRHWNIGGKWMAPWNLADDSHVYGLDWNRDELVYYVDGVVVRRMKNTHWHQPLYLIFDSETMPTWMGMPDDDDLPSTYHVDYVRVWKKHDYETGRARSSYLEVNAATKVQETSLDLLHEVVEE